jgi:ribosome biogenesis GTPase
LPATDIDALARLGWDEKLEEDFAPHAAAGLVPARVAVQHRGAYAAYTGSGSGSGLEETTAEVAGRLRREALTALDLPAVGDWVALEAPPGRRAVIQAVLPRRTVFVRRAPSDQHRTVEEQVVAANVDTVFLVSALMRELSLRRLERYLVLAWESGARPVVVLTKADLCSNAPVRRAEVEGIAPGVHVHVVSNVTGEGLDELRPYFADNRTVGALGSSGVGKSTLINRLAGRDLQETGGVRRDGRGRHTTTRRALIPVPGGGLFLDTPGMRELQLWDADVEEAFADVADLAAGCRFRDCAHGQEPGCAVLSAVRAGTLDPQRLESFVKLRQEVELLERRLGERALSDRRRDIRRAARPRRRSSW